MVKESLNLSRKSTFQLELKLISEIFRDFQYNYREKSSKFAYLLQIISERIPKINFLTEMKRNFGIFEVIIVKSHQNLHIRPENQLFNGTWKQVGEYLLSDFGDLSVTNVTNQQRPKQTKADDAFTH